MERSNTLDMRVKIRKVFLYFIFISTVFIIYKLMVIESGVDRLQVLKEALEIHKEQLQLTQQQLLLLEHLESNTNNKEYSSNLPTIYAITPTYWRYVQRAELTRISQTLKLVPNIHWIVIEDAEKKTDLVRDLIQESNVVTTHLNAKTPPANLKEKDPRVKRHRGVDQRNMGLKWLRDNLQLHKDNGVVYFMDDDNTYSIKLFDEINKVRKVGIWPVGLVGGLNAEAPIVDPRSGKVTGYRSGWKPSRKFAIDMAGFAINLELILTKKDALFSHQMEKGYQESEFLSYFTTRDELEPLADNCTKVYVWHTRTEKPHVSGVIPGLVV